MHLSLRTRVFLMVAAINVAVFALGGAFLVRRIQAQQERNAQVLADDLVFSLGSTLRTSGELSVARLLNWPGWRAVEDSVLVDRNLESYAGGALRPRGVALNPVGLAHRDASFDHAGVLAAIRRSFDGARAYEPIEGGRAVRILALREDGRPELWGGCWYRVRPESPWPELLRGLLPWFIGSTLLLTGGTFLLLRRVVLSPVEELARGARRVSQGQLDWRVPQPERHDELAELVRSFNEMTATVQGFNQHLAQEVQRATQQARAAEAAAMTQRRLAAMGELAAGIAHEINNPLGGMINAAQALARPDLPEAKRAQYRALIESGLERIRLIVGQLLRFTPRAASFESLLVSDVVVDALALVRFRAEREQIALEWRAPEREPRVRGLRNELGQALLNLLVNALDALAGSGSGGTRTPNGRVTVELRSAGDRLALSVRDNGPGLTPELLARAPDLFFSTKQVGQGSGLGLTIAHDIVARHGGKLELTSQPGAGLCATIELPLQGEGGA